MGNKICLNKTFKIKIEKKSFRIEKSSDLLKSFLISDFFRIQKVFIFYF